MQSTTRRNILWVLALVVALVAVGVAYVRQGPEHEVVIPPEGPRVPDDPGRGCGAAAATDPACIKSPLHARMTAVATSGRPAGDVAPGAEGFVYRRIGADPQQTNPAPLKPDPALTA